MSTTLKLLEPRVAYMVHRGLPNPNYVSVFGGKTIIEMIEWLALSTSVNVRTFDIEGLKFLAELWIEYVDREIILARRADGGVDRHASSSRIMAVVPSMGIRYREVGRRYLRKNFYLEHAAPKWSAFTETGKHGETPLETAISATTEELAACGIPIEDPLECLNDEPEIDIHESSVYPGIRSIAFVTRFKLELLAPLWEEDEYRIIKDGSIEVHIQEFPYTE